LAEPVGLVPTMGALHAGHLALVRAACERCKSVVVSIFVNPLQFGPQEDFARYPRRLAHDRELLSSAGVSAIFAPSVEEMYAQPPLVTVDPGSIGEHLEGERRPGHFRGVATVVLKLLELVRPQYAFFGQKDAQQLAVVQRMVSDLNCDTEIVSCPTVREPDGLALSSRNAYLSADERRAAPRLFQTLRAVAERLSAGRTDVPALLAELTPELSPLRPDYLAVVRPEEFLPLAAAPPGATLLAVGAAFAGKTRLIDNIAVKTP